MSRSPVILWCLTATSTLTAILGAYPAARVPLTWGTLAMCAIACLAVVLLPTLPDALRYTRAGKVSPAAARLLQGSDLRRNARRPPAHIRALMEEQRNPASLPALPIVFNEAPRGQRIH